MKKFKIFVLAQLMLFGIASCGSNDKESNKPIELTFTTYEDNGKDFYIDKENITEAYKKVNPNVTVKVEIIPNTEYDQAMKIRNTGKKLPDVFITRLVFMNDFKDTLLPLNELEATKKNLFAKEFAIDGKIYGLPSYGFNEFVYYRKSIFKELGLEVPQTWTEFLEIVKKIRDSKKYIAVSLGIKDSWVDYPFNEFMPFYEKDGNDIWSKMAQDDEPFSKGKPFYEAYKKINDFYALKGFGNDPLGLDWSQERANFVAGKAAMLAAGGWYYSDFLKNADEKSKNDVGVFLLPTRNSKNDDFRYMVAADLFVGINKKGANIEAAKEFVNWYFTSDYYNKFIEFKKTLPTMKGVKAADDMFGEAVNNIDKPVPVLQKAGGIAYDKIAKTINFDVKAMGQEMIKGIDFENYMKEYNKKWKEAKESN